ncbi:alpha-glucuronidase [Mangrovihabitans endophyticus]|uniref:Xylan alpha-1,2-glucuronidase n=1 Tax=Mangrovihabitans endophyticus TaxID=1751298 RepID=A0A8J3FPD1_9ACTN|nr:alpha-glucuronidase [Mangrovihabitans endophyticus]GGL00391.1 xylan alpha-1,2-glucuronidase [Mangrovihabitans endophyticus]
MTGDARGWHAGWLPSQAWRAIGTRRVFLPGPSGAGAAVAAEAAGAAGADLVETVAAEIAAAVRTHGGRLDRTGPAGPADLVLALAAAGPGDGVAGWDDLRTEVAGTLGAEGFAITRRAATLVCADAPAGLLHGLFHVLRAGDAAFGAPFGVRRHRPAMRRRMVDHWDNVDVHPVMGQVERGYAGGSLFWTAGAFTADPARIRAYARLLAACGVNAVAVNNVNVHPTEARLLTDRIGEVAAIAGWMRPYGIRVHLSVSFAAPRTVGALHTADPCDPAVRAWWAAAARDVYAAIPDFGGFVVKADSEGQPGPFGYGRDHADGANMLADALAPHGGVVHWRAFVYNHHQDWRDRGTDRAKAAHQHFAPLDGRFRDTVIVQVKHGPVDFQTREPVSPVIAAMPGTRLAVEVQATQEYTGQQRHVCYLGTPWSETLGFGWAGGQTVASVAAAGGGLVAVANTGADAFWTGHPLAQANLYAYGRLAWDPALDPCAVLDEWITLTFGAAAGPDAEPRRTLHAIMDDSWRGYERYTAPLGVGFMVRPGHHYGPDVDGYEYTGWGTYHFADRDGVGVDRTRATGTGFTGQYPQPWSRIYESPDECPDELLLFFHHVPYGHVLRSGTTVIQHIYDSHFAGVEQVERMRERWRALPPGGLLSAALHARVSERLDEQVRSAREWRDQINAYFFRKSGVPDADRRALDGARRPVIPR